jgi:hypothetical protein
MGRALLILAAATLLAACRGEGGAAVRVAGTDTLASAGAYRPAAHAALPCAACHTGALAGTRIAAVPRESCAAAGCHVEGGPTQVSTKTATFRHLDHARDGEVALSCAGCHTHSEGGQELQVSVDACALCHLGRLEGSEPSDCRTCHQQPQHVALTSQALPIPHSSLPWVETGCVRCHYDVAEPLTRVALARCSACHGRDTTLVVRGIARDLHPTHTAVTCTACHDGEAHRVRAMSSAVQLVCGDCHVRAHDLTLGEQWSHSATCTHCHETVHQPQQRLLLGMLPGEAAVPSSKFIAGMTCRSCHMRSGPATASGAAGDAIRGQAQACAGCHRTEYGRVLAWWLAGTRARTRAVSAYVTRGARELGSTGSDSVRALVASSLALIELVESAGGQHNLELSDRIFRQSVARVRAAYSLAGRAPPPAPSLGSPAHEGTCSFCHYSPDDPWDFRRMSAPFHRDALGVDR